MKLNAMMDSAYQTLMQHAENTPVLLLHPDSRYRSILIAMLINDDEVLNTNIKINEDLIFK